jgi:hypothetical protein
LDGFDARIHFHLFNERPDLRVPCHFHDETFDAEHPHRPTIDNSQVEPGGELLGDPQSRRTARLSRVSTEIVGIWTEMGWRQTQHNEHFAFGGGL